MTINEKKLLLQSDQGGSFWFLGDLFTFKAVGEDTGGKYTLFEILIQPQSGSPFHINTWEDKAFYIQEGEFEFQLGERTIVATAGTFLNCPKGQPHIFTNIGSTPAKMLCWCAPSGIENFFAQVGSRVEDPQAPPPPISRADIEKLLATAPKYGIKIILPGCDPC